MSRNDINRQLSENQQLSQTLSRLSPEDRNQLLSLLHATQQNGRVDPNLIGLIQSGRLISQDKDGKRVLDHLTTLSQQRLAPGLDRLTTLRDMAKILNDPDKFDQNRQGTCTVTTVGRMHLAENPADFARMMVGLTSEHGQTTTQAGDRIQRHPGSLRPGDRSERSHLERLYQDALMEFGNGTDQDYNTAGDHHQDRNGNNLGSGLAIEKVEKVSESVLGRRFSVHRINPGSNPDGLHAQIFRNHFDQIKRQGREMVVYLQWGDGAHALSVYEIKDGYVYLSNPWGDGDQGGSSPPREVVPGEDGGRIRMKVEDFFKHLYAYQGHESAPIPPMLSRGILQKLSLIPHPFAA